MSRASGAVGAIVLTGGRGSRLGGLDKARLTVSGRPMVETVLRAARAIAGPIITVGPGGDTREDPPHSGPVAGIAAGLATVPEEVDLVVVVACDLPGLDADTLRSLVGALRDARDRGAAAALGVDPTGHDQFLLAAWDRRALAARLNRLAAGGGVAGLPVRALYDAVELRRVPVGDHALDVDTWSDLAGRGPVALEHVGAVLRDGLPDAPATFRAPLEAVGGVLAEPIVAADPMPGSGSRPWTVTPWPGRGRGDSPASPGGPAMVRPRPSHPAPRRPSRPAHSPHAAQTGCCGTN